MADVTVTTIGDVRVKKTYIPDEENWRKLRVQADVYRQRKKLGTVRGEYFYQSVSPLFVKVIDLTTGDVIGEGISGLALVERDIDRKINLLLSAWK